MVDSKSSEKAGKGNTGKSEKMKPPTLKIELERDIAMDFAGKVYKKFSDMIKSVVLFGSSAKKTAISTSDIDVIIIIDDVSTKWDMELISWYREELGKIVAANPYRKSLHINTVKLSTWWVDMIKGDPVVINVIRYGEPLIDMGGFFIPLKVLLQEGKIRSTPEAIYTLLERAPSHVARARASVLSVIDGLYWAMVDSAHAALISANALPPSPEHITDILKEKFVDTRIMKMNYVDDFRDIHILAKTIVHGGKVNITGRMLDDLFTKTDNFVSEMARIIDMLNAKR